MAVESTIWLFCLLSLAYCGPFTQEKPLSVELSCGAGPVHVVLEPGTPLLLDCNLGASDPPFNVTWLRNGQPLHLDGRDFLQHLSNGSLLLLPTFTDGHASPGLEGSYSCVSASALGALTSRTITVLLASLSPFHQDPASQVVPVGGAARFECQIEGVPTPVITWEKDQAAIPAETRFISLPNGVLQILEVTRGDEGAYRCVASNSAKTRLSLEASLTITTGSTQALNKVEIVAPPQNATVVLGRPAVMECMAQGQPKPLVSWSRQDGKPISTDVVVLATNLVIRDTRRHHAGVYVCRANKPKTREFVIAAAELHVPAPPVILQPPETVSLSRGNTARFVCNSSGEPPPVLYWLKNGQPIRSLRRVKTQGPGVLLINQLALEDAGYYQCIADNSLGTACATAKLTVIVREGLPSPPRHLSVTPHASTAALLTWEKPEHNSDQIIGYSVHYQRTAGGSDNVEYQFAMNNDTTEYHVKELLPHTAYTFYVVAYSPMGASRPSIPVTVEMLEDVPSTPPQLSIASTSPTDIRLMWHPLSSQHSRGAVTRYRIEYSTLDQADQVFSVEVAGNETQFTLRELQPNHTYRLRMAAGTGAGFGMPSEWTHHHTLAHYNNTMVIFAPTELKVKAKMNTLNITWQPSPNHTQISGYKLSCREVEAEEQVSGQRTPLTHIIRLRKKARHHLITDLVSDQQYEVRVWAFNKLTEGSAAVWKGRTEKVRDTTKIEMPMVSPLPLPPSGVQATANSSTSIWLRWEKPRFSNLRIINYTVRCSPAGITNASLVTYHTSSAQEILLGALKPFTLYELAVQSNGVDEVGPFSGKVEESTLADRPSTPPEELQLSALDSSSVLVSWRPPLEPNGIIISYRILYSGNLSQPDQLWASLSQDGTITSTEIQGLASGTRYFFKMGASTEVGQGPYSPIKDVHTPPQKYELDIHAVTGIIVGVCLGLLCILLCMCFSFRNGKSREVSGGLNSAALTPEYRRGGRPVPTSVPERNDCHELETLMPPGRQEPGQQMSATPEEQSLMSSVGLGAAEDPLAPEAKAAWNGSVSRNWANRITRYRDTITEDSPTLINGALNILKNDDGKELEEHLFSSLCSNQVEAEVIVHSELSDPGREKGEVGCNGEEESDGTRGLSFSEVGHSPLSRSTQPGREEPILPSPFAQTPMDSSFPVKFVSNHNGELEGVTAQRTADLQLYQDVGLTNGFHSPKALQSQLRPEPLENGDSRHCLPALGKSIPSGLPLSPSPFVSSGLVHATSTAHL